MTLNDSVAAEGMSILFAVFFLASVCAVDWDDGSSDLDCDCDWYESVLSSS